MFANLVHKFGENGVDAFYPDRFLEEQLGCDSNTETKHELNKTKQKNKPRNCKAVYARQAFKRRSRVRVGGRYLQRLSTYKLTSRSV